MFCTTEECVEEATQVRPADRHVSGSPAAQKLCDDCTERYDKKIQELQKSYRETRKKDLEKRREERYR